jgi:transposase InsO family protein
VAPVSSASVLTDNAFAYRGILFNQALEETRVLHRYCRPYRPQTNGKVERYNRTLLEEWAYVRPYWRECDRTRALARWLHIYNHHRVHTAIGGPLVSRVTNLPRSYNLACTSNSPSHGEASAIVRIERQLHRSRHRPPMLWRLSS